MILLAMTFFTNIVALAIDTEEIDRIFRKAQAREVLEDFELQQVENFLDTAFEELLAEAQFDEPVVAEEAVSTPLAEILKRIPQQPMDLYSDTYNTTTTEYVKKMFTEVQQWDDSQKKTKFQRSLIIIVANLRSTELLETSLTMLDHKNPTIRYWAVKAVTNNEIVKLINEDLGFDPDLADKIFDKLTAFIDTEEQSDIINLIVNFAARVDTTQAMELLDKIVDMRTRAYADWTVQYELTDAILLKSLAKRILDQRSESERASLGRKFAQLYSYMMQRYILASDSLPDISKHYTASALVEVEQTVLGKLLRQPQSIIKRAIEKDRVSSLQREHDSLFGDPSRSGRLGDEFGFDYGKDASGKAINTPKKLKAPPEETKTTEAPSSE